MGSTGIPEPLEYLTITDGNVDVTFLGLIETNGKQTATIPSTHPLKVEGITFARPENVVSQYSSIKEQENSDLYIALTHLGYDLNFGLGDTQLASQFPYFDMIIGGHTHITENGVVNNIPIFNAGGYLNTLGKVVMRIRDKNIDVYSYEVIDLNSYQEFDSDLQAIIDQYNDLPYLKEVIGYSHQYHNNSQVGCFYTDALRGEMDVDVSFQNTGGIRSSLDEGDITVREIFEISPFNNGTIIYQMTVTEIKDFLVGSASGFYYSGIQLEQDGNSIIFKDLDNNILSDDTVLSVGINDYIPAVYDTYFPTNGILQSMTAAETIISYLKTKNNQVDYSDCNRYFRYQLEIE